MKDAITYYPSDWIAASVKNGIIYCVEAERSAHSFYRTSEVWRSRIKIKPSYREFEDAIHELGHRMEYVVAGIKEAEAEFYSRRTSGEKLEKLSVLTGNSNYGDGERARKDKFLNVYMGKDYGGSAYELVSQGFESAYTNPLFLLEDEDMARWIYGLLALI